MPLPLAVAVAGLAWSGFKLAQGRRDRLSWFPSVPAGWWEPKDPLYYVKWRALAALRQGERIHALARGYVERHPDHGLGHANLAMLLSSQHDWKAALVHAKRHLELEPDHPVALYLVASCLSTLGDDRAALPLWRRFLELDPKSYYAAVARTQVERIANVSKKRISTAGKSRRRTARRGKAGSRSRT